MIEPDYLGIIKILYPIFQKTEARWVLVGSASLALQGIDIVPRDLDVLTDGKGAREIANELKEWEISAVYYKKSKLFKSYFGEYVVGGLKVEIMGDLHVKLDGEWEDVSPMLANPKIVELDGMRIPVQPLEFGLRMYRGMAREKDGLRIRLIEERLTAESF